MRLLLVFLFLVAAGWTAWVFTGMKTSYAGLSEDQLTTLENDFSYVSHQKDHDAAQEAEISRSIIADERRRRSLELPSIGATAGVLVRAVLLSFVGGKRKLTDEEQRFLATLGNPNELAAARHKAAAALGVTVDAPPQVIEAAFDAQLKLHDTGRMDGLSPQLREVAQRKIDELEQAKNLLLRSKSAPS